MHGLKPTCENDNFIRVETRVHITCLRNVMCDIYTVNHESDILFNIKLQVTLQRGVFQSRKLKQSQISQTRGTHRALVRHRSC